MYRAIFAILVLMLLASEALAEDCVSCHKKETP